MPETTKKKIPIPKSLTEGQLQPQSEMLAVERKKGNMYIGVPKVETMQENRIALVPSAVATLTGHDYRVVIEAGAGEKANYTDHRYSEAGGEIAYEKEKVFQANILLKVAPLTMEDIEMCHPNQIVISPLHIPILSQEFIQRILQKKITALAMEYIQDDSGSFPMVRVMSEMAGIGAVLTAGELLATTSGGKGVLLAGIAGVPSAKIVILGAGVVGESATRVALGLGAEIRVFDNDVYKLMRLQRHVGRQLNTSTFNPYQIEKELLNADVVIGAVHSKTGRAPVIVTEEMVEKMKPGSVIIDVSIDQGGCFETSEMTSHHRPTFIKHGVIHYCVPNMASKIPRTASIAISNIFTPLLLRAGKVGGMEELLYEHAGLRNGVYAYKGRLTNSYLSRRFDIKYTDLDLLMTSRL
ncbi:MAG: alanine dehydrogenase [Lewinellaceae bacterium]|nr:alanine dehydrogenase [Saprospiraceae bacterium]MCB9339782.1 alanine dehydrogenase [Lewinellaceae bacterium]